MASKKISDSEKVLETEDLILRLGTNKGKRPMEETSDEERRWKRFCQEVESESTARSTENILTRMEDKLDNVVKELKERTNKLEADLKLRADKVEKKMENHFLHVNTCLYCQQGRSQEYFNALNASIETIIRFLNPRIGPVPIQVIPPRPNTPSSSNAPSSSKGPQK